VTRNTPELISALHPGEVFVFGSNAAGAHAGGAARFAVERFGAVWGVGEGIQGQSYAVPTMGSLGELVEAIDRLLAYAAAHPELTFLVTKLGTGIAGLTVEQVAPLFAGHGDNVILPAEFEVSA
jgi:hypothetical protein